MSEKWDDRWDAVPLTQEQSDREAMPDYALVDSRMREQRAADGQGRTPGNFSGGPSPEQGPLVPIATMDPEVRAAIEELRGWIQECADGVSNLGTRVAKLEDAAREWRDRQHGINGDIYRDMHRYDDKLALASINGDNALDQRIQARAIELEHRIDALKARVIESVPSVGEAMIQEQCDEAWTEEHRRELAEASDEEG